MLCYGERPQQKVNLILTIHLFKVDLELQVNLALIYQNNIVLAT